MKLGIKISLGFGIILSVGILLTAIALFSMRGVTSQARNLSQQYMPQTRIASTIERVTSRAVSDMNRYEVVYEGSFLAAARNNLKQARNGLSEAEQLIKNFPHLTLLQNNSANALAKISEFDNQVNETEKTGKAIAELRKNLESDAQEFLKSCLEFLEDQNTMVIDLIKQGNAGSTVFKSQVEKIGLINEVIQLVYAIQLDTVKGQLTRDPQLIENSLKKFIEIENSLNTIQKISSSATVKAQLEDIRLAGSSYKTNTKKLVNSYATLIDLAKKRGDTGAAALTSVETTAVSGIDETMKSAVSMENITKRSGNILLVIGLIGLSICICMIFILTRNIVSPVRHTVLMLKDISEGEGDLTKRLDISSRDEIGEFASLFNVFMEKLQTMIRKISQNSTRLETSSLALNSIAGQMANRLGEITNRSNNVATATEELSTNLSNVAAASEQATTNVNMVSAAAEEMTSTVHEIAQNSGRAREISEKAVVSASEASTKVNELGEAALQISKVTEVITEISEQTNLLALNATIEAARAGEAGKGFAVVANEIKELARQTATATHEIKGRIEGIQASTNMTVKEISNISKVIEDVNGIVNSIAAAVEQQSVSSQEIANNIAQASQGINEVNENVNQTSSVSASINSDLSGVNHGVQDVLTNSSEVEHSANELSGLAKQLQSLVGHFKTE